jgi:hypothetical protein
MHGKLLLMAVMLTVMLAFASPDPALVVPAGEKMKPEELIAKHLEAIGTAAARAAVKNRMMNGSAQVIFPCLSGCHLTLVFRRVFAARTP